MMVDPVVDGYTKTLNHRKIVRKMQKYRNLLKTNIILKPKYKLSGDLIFTFSLPVGAIHPSLLRQLRHWLSYIVFTYSKMSQLNCNKIRAVNVA